MASGSAADGVFGNLFGASISTDDIGIQRRPYHRNCNCALHKSNDHHCHHPSLHKVSYPIRRSWSEGSLVAMTSASASSAGSSPCCPSSPAPTVKGAARLPPRGANCQLSR